MNEIDQERLKDLHDALSSSMEKLGKAYNMKKYLWMAENASDIVRLSYTIQFLNGNDGAGRGSMTKFVPTETIEKMQEVKEQLVEAQDVEELLADLNETEKETLLRLYIDQSRKYRNVSGIFHINYREGTIGYE